MNPDLSKKAVEKIEKLCAHGCSEVNQLLERAKNGNHIEELSEFDHAEIKRILDELDQIMSVYTQHD